MIALKYFLISGGLGMILLAVSILAYDSYSEILYRQAVKNSDAGAVPPAQLRWRTSLALRCWPGGRS